MALGKRNDLNIAKNQKSQNLKNSKPIRTFWKRSNWNRNEIRYDNDLLRTLRNCLVTSNSSDPKRKKKEEKIGVMNTESALENKTSLLL